MNENVSTFTRRNLLRSSAGFGALALAGLGLAACSTGPSGGTASEPASSGSDNAADAGAFPVTIKHVYGETTVKEEPKRVATVSWVNGDIVVALGVVPVGLPKINWGQNENDSTPWLDEGLKSLGAAWDSDKAPAHYSEADGINFTEVAKAAPDLILGVYSGLSKEDYDKLSKIAPVIAYPDTAYGTAWEDATAIIGKALGREEKAREVTETTKKLLAEKASAHPSIKGKSYIASNLEPAKGDGVNVYTPHDNRARVLAELGMVLAPIVAEKSKGSKEFFIPWSAEKANELVSDVMVSWVPDEKTVDQIKKDPLLGQIPAIKNDAFVAYADKSVTLSISAASPLSLPWGIDRVLAPIAEATAKSGK